MQGKVSTSFQTVKKNLWKRQNNNKSIRIFNSAFLIFFFILYRNAIANRTIMLKKTLALFATECLCIFVAMMVVVKTNFAR